MAISLPDARRLSDEVLEALRLRALRGCELGFSEADVAELLGVSRETVSRWWTAYAAGGTEAIPGDRTGRPVGTGRTLSDEQARRIQDLIDDHGPEELGIAAAVWSRKAVRDLIGKECGVAMPVRTVGEYLKRWGYTAKVPRRHAKDQDPDEVAEWLNETYPAIEGRAAREGDPARAEVPKPHIRMNLVATITNEGEVHFLTSKETMTAALFLTFLEKLVSETTRKVFLILDRLPAHEAKSVADWVARHGDRIELFWLPKYAPERNADEYLNNDLKGAINAEGLPGSQGELRSRIEWFMSKLLQLPERVRSYFRHPCVQYAAGE